MHRKYRMLTLWVKRGLPGMIPLEYAGLEVRRELFYRMIGVNESANYQLEYGYSIYK
jgi:hypothetical protein